MTEPLFETGSTVLFQGDSITDGDRYREDPVSLGRGYAMIAAGWFSALYPDRKIAFLNRGVSGDRTINLAQRWDEDCIALKPDWVSIMIGINDTWRRYDNDDPTPAEAYEAAYRDILERTRAAGDARFILVEPFVLPWPSDRVQWREDLDPRIDVVHRLAQEFDAVLVTMDKVFAQSINGVHPSFWALDGVHPTPAGHALMAQAWLRAVGALAG